MKEYLTLAEIQKDIREEGLTCVKLVDHYLQQIESGKHLNAFVEVYTEEAKKAALAVDARITNGTAGKLAGLVIGLKDVLSPERPWSAGRKPDPSIIPGPFYRNGRSAIA